MIRPQGEPSFGTDSSMLSVLPMICPAVFVYTPRRCPEAFSVQNPPLSIWLFTLPLSVLPETLSKLPISRATPVSKSIQDSPFLLCSRPVLMRFALIVPTTIQSATNPFCAKLHTVL